MERRTFLKNSASALALSMVPNFSLFGKAFSEDFFGNDAKKITILHTNDQHSRIEPFEKSSNTKYSEKGGFARRAEMIHEIRQAEKNVLLLDVGDVFQGTPYFNMFAGELEYKLMSMMKYDAGTIGNHEYDNGLQGFKDQLPHAKFDIISSNYDFSNTVLENAFKPYKILTIDGVKIGIFAVGVELYGLVNPKCYLETKYLDPVEVAQDMSQKLKIQEKCDLVICLSHIGYEYPSQPEKICDKILASKTKNIDLILGGHTHTFLEKPEIFTNLDGKSVYYNQVGWAGLLLGRLDFYFQKGQIKDVAFYHQEDCWIV